MTVKESVIALAMPQNEGVEVKSEAFENVQSTHTV